jgi:hypothetical protein
MDITGHAVDFTESNYKRLLQMASVHYSFEAFGTTCTTPHVLWRHDIDMSVHRALALAQIEADAGVRATYFVLPHSRFYNLLERTVTLRARTITSLGHSLGLHFDARFYGEIRTADEMSERLAQERDTLENLLDAPVLAFSFHDPTTADVLHFDDDIVAGMVNAYGRNVRGGYVYCSDSNGYWRHDRLEDVLSLRPERLHVLTHPEWWVPQVMSPRERVSRCIDGRAAAQHLEYDTSMAAIGRTNVGGPSSQ